MKQPWHIIWAKATTTALKERSGHSPARAKKAGSIFTSSAMAAPTSRRGFLGQFDLRGVHVHRHRCYTPRRPGPVAAPLRSLGKCWSTSRVSPRGRPVSCGPRHATPESLLEHTSASKPHTQRTHSPGAQTHTRAHIRTHLWAHGKNKKVSQNVH